MATRRAFSRSRTGGRAAVWVVAALLAALLGPVALAAPAYADSYPSWSDVLKARKSQAAAKREVNALQNLVASLERQVQQTRAAVTAAGNAYETAEAKSEAAEAAYQDEKAEAKRLQQQADAADAQAADSERRAGEWAAQLVQASGPGADIELRLFDQSADAGALFSAIGVSSRFAADAEAEYATAVQQRNSAQSLTDQANAAKAALADLSTQAAKAADAAEQAVEAAQAASEAATKAELAQQQHEALLKDQLDVLTKKRRVTEADYQIGVQKSLKDKYGIDWAKVSSSGWVRPANGFISSPFGWRNDPFSGLPEFHQGVDIAEPCGNPILAAHTGTVVFEGWYGVNGYTTIISHGGGLETLYAHQPSSAMSRVHVGESVHVAQRIGTIGSSGESTGCHTKFGVLVNGQVIDPVPFMAAEGVVL